MLKYIYIYTLAVIQMFFCCAFAVEDSVSISDAQIVTGISYDEIEQKAKEHSYDLKIADFNILISKQGVKGARSEYFPKLNLSAGLEYTKNFREGKDVTVMSIGDSFINPYTRYQSILGISLSYNVFDFGVRGGNLKIAKEDTLLKELEEKEQWQELQLNLVDTYTKILIAKKQIELNNQILTIAEKNLALKKRLYKAREISKPELNSQVVAVEDIKKSIHELYSIISENLNWLSFYTGDKYDINNISVAEMVIPPFNTYVLDDITKSLTWKIHEKNIKKKELEVKVAQRTNYPKVSAYSKYYMYGSNHASFGDSLDIRPSNFAVGGSIYMPVFDGLKNRANIQKTKLELQQLYVERDKAIAQLMTRLSIMQSNVAYLNEQIENNENIIKELNDKENSTKRLAEKRLVSPIDVNEVKIERLKQEIELEKNKTTADAITKGIEILTRAEENPKK